MTEHPEIESRIRALIAKLFDLSPAQAAGDLRLGDPPQWDSMGHMELLVAIENEFQVRFPAQQIAALTSVDRIAEAIRAYSRS